MRTIPLRASPVHNRRSKGCLACCSKTQLFFAYLLVIVGALFLALTCYLFLAKGDVIPLIHSHFYINCIHLAAACGFFNIVIGFLVHSAVNNRCALVFYILIIIFSMILEGCLLYFTFSYHATYSQELEASLPSDIVNEFGQDEQITAAINALQKSGKCCGSNAFNDWPKPIFEDDEYLPYAKTIPKRVQYVPDTCCKSDNQRKGCALSDSPNNIYYDGCLPKLKEMVYENLNFVFVVSGASLLLHFISIILGCCVCFKLDDDEEEQRLKEYDQEMHLFD